MPAADASRVRAGDRVELTTNNGQKVEGQVRSATGVVDPQTRQATAVVTPTGGGSLIAPGQLVQARIFARGGDPAPGVNVPQDAVQPSTARPGGVVGTRTGAHAPTGRGGQRH